MFKFKCIGTFTKGNIIDKKYFINRCYDIPNTKSSPRISIATIKPPRSALASYSDYLFDDYTADRDNKLRRKNVIDFPEIKDADSCLTTNDGLVIFNYNKDNYCIVYDLVYDNKTTFDSIGVDIQNHIDLIKYCKYTSPRVHCLNIVEGKVKPDIKFIDSDDTYHFFVDCDLVHYEDGIFNEHTVDDYFYYQSDEKIIEFDSATFKKQSKVIVSDTKFSFKDKRAISCIDGYYYCVLNDNDSEYIEIIFDENISKEVYVCC